MNVQEIATKLDRRRDSVSLKIMRLRDAGRLPPIERNNEINFQPYSEHAKKRIIYMVSNGYSDKEIAASLGRSIGGITNRVSKLIKNGECERRHKKISTQHLLDHLQFDENGCVFNTPELANYFGVSKQSVYQKVHKLRKAGIIRTIPKDGRASIKWIEAMKKINDTSYTLYLAKRRGNCCEESRRCN